MIFCFTWVTQSVPWRAEPPVEHTKNAKKMDQIWVPHQQYAAKIDMRFVVSVKEIAS